MTSPTSCGIKILIPGKNRIITIYFIRQLMEKLERAREYLMKAATMLDWSAQAVERMIELGKQAKIDEIKQHFFNLLSYISIASEAISSASRLAKLKDWNAEFESRNDNDPLLKYFWAARNVDVHDRLIRWSPDLVEVTMRILDAEKFIKAGSRYPLIYNPYTKGWCFLLNAPTEREAMRKFFAGTIPTSERMEEAGVELIDTLHALQLVPFSTNQGKERNFSPPTLHLGNPIIQSVDITSRSAINYYRRMHKELSNIIETSIAKNNQNFSFPAKR